MAVTRDATSGIWYPATSAEVTALYSGRSISAPVHGYKCDEAAGNLADFIGSVPLVKFNAPLYQQTFPGHARKAIGYVANNDCHFVSPVAAGDVGDISNVSTSILLFGAAANGLGTAPPTAIKDIINLGASPNDRHFQWTAASKFQIVGTGQAAGGGTATPGTGVHPVIFEVNRGGGAIVAQTDQETIAPTYTAPAGGAAYISIGPDAVGDASQTTTLVGYMLMWAGAAAEFTAAQRASIIDCHYNGPAVASVAVTPTPVALAFVGATQQLTATATRTDGTTFDCTDGTNVPSTATATWTSDNTGVATVSVTGLVTAVAGGTANIRRAFTSLNAATATSNASVVTVASGPTYTAIDVSPSPGQAFVGGTKQFTATGTLSGGGTADVTTTATWSSSSPTVGTVGAATGLATGVAAGSTLITATLGLLSSTVGLSVLASAGVANDLAQQQANLYGEDIYFDVSHADQYGNADYVASAAGDWQDVAGVEALRQSLLRRLITNPGEWATLPDFGVGARQYIKALNTAANRAELEARVRSQFMADDRVESIEQVTITEVVGDMPGLTIFVNVIPVGRLRQDATLPIQITIT